MSTFIGSMVGFTLMVLLGIKYVAPPVRRLMASQQDTVRRQLDESAQATRKLEGADAAHAKAVRDAEADAKRIVDEAHGDAERITGQLRAQADVEVERIKVAGEQQIQLLRAQLVRRLRAELGAESVQRAGEVVREHVADGDRQAATVDRFLDELDDMAPAATTVDSGGAAAALRSASREALGATTDTFERVTDGESAEELSSLADELAAVVRLLHREPVVANHLTEPSDDAGAKVALTEALLSGKVGDAALEVVRTAVSQRWSSPDDLADAVEYVARLALLVRAERDDEVDDVEDQLFRFGRVLDDQPQLTGLLSDDRTPADGRVELLGRVLDDLGVTATAAALLRQTVALLRGRRAEEAVLELAELAVQRRGEAVAHVTAAAELSDEQRTRLGEVLARIYGRSVAIQLQIDPALLGGLSIAVGDEVIDGSLSSRLAAAETQLPD